MASANNGARDSGSDFDRFMAANVHPAYAGTDDVAKDDSAPEKETMGPGISGVLSAPRPQSAVSGETNGARYAPQTTVQHPAAHEPGMPAGFTSAKNLQ
jgi:hypothetical protein